MRRGRRGDHAGQLHIEWNPPAEKAQPTVESPLPASVSSPLVQRLPWDFKKTFPKPTQEAIDAGTISDEDTEPENVRAIHDEHARELLMTLHDLDAVLDARRRGVDPRNNKAPMLQEAKERLQKFFETEPARLERWFQTLMDTYESAFGAEAADAFGKAVRAWHAGIEVTDQKPAAAAPSVVPIKEPKSAPQRPPRISRQHKPSRIIARLPVPKPLPSAVAAGRFGLEENGKPIRPGAHEVRAITEQHAEKLIELLDSIHSGPMSGKETLQAQFNDGIAAYGEDFGPNAAKQLEAYALRQSALDPSSRRDR